MDKIGGIVFCCIFSALGWVFGPFETEPVAAAFVATTMTIIGIGGMVYFAAKEGA